MGDLLGVSVEELVAILRKKHARLPFEIGAFVALETCEALQKGPAKVSPAEVMVTDDGSVSVYAPPNSATGAEAAQSVVGILSHLLLAAGAGVPGVLIDLVEHGPADGRWDLSRLRDELEASLVPLNRQAARRVLSRMLRDARREGGGRLEIPEAVSEHVDAELDALISGGDPPPTRAAEPAPAPAPEPEPVHETAPRPDPPAAARHQPIDRPSAWTEETTSKERRTPPSPAPIPVASEREVPTPVARRGELDLSGLDEAGPRRRGGLAWALVFILLIAVLVGGVAYLRPDVVDRFLGRESPEQREAARLEEERARAQAELRDEHAQRFGHLVVNVSPPRAQVLLFVGRGPAVASHLPPGVAHEFIAIADGRSPTRAVVPKDAEWEDTEDGPRYELAMQTGETDMALADLDLGATRLPRDMGTPRPELGSVRIVTNPPGAKVYQLVGFAPQVRIENLRTDQPQELLVWHEGHAPSRVVVGPSDFREVDGTRIAEVEVALDPRE